MRFSPQTMTKRQARVAGLRRGWVRWALACLPGASLWLAGTALADDLLDLPIEQLMQVKVTTATLSDESLRTVPSSLSVFTREDIRRLGLTNLNALINLVPGYQGSRGDDSTLSFSLSSRGRRVGSSGREVLVLLNGQRLNNDWTGGAGQHTNLIPIENVERVELIRGPGSALYGSNALMGVINIITRSERELTVAAGPEGYRHGSFQWQAASEQGSVELYARDSRREGAALPLFEPFAHPATPVMVDSQDPFRADDLYLRGMLGEFTLSAYSSSRDSQQFYVAGYVDDNSNAYDTRAHFLTLEWQHALGDSLTLEGRLFQNERQLDVESAVSLVPYYLLDGVVDERERGTQWIVQGDAGSARWLLGWEWRNPELTDSRYSFGPPANPHQVQAIQAEEGGRYIQGWFGQYQQALTDALQLIAGLRHDAYSDFGEHLSPRLGLVQQAGRSDTFKVLYSEAFRAPSRIETSVLSQEFKSNPDLQPETARTGELVWMHVFGTGYVTGTLFDTCIDDAILETVTPQLQRTWVNGQQSVSGLELEWLNRWGERWESRLAFTRFMHLDTDVSAESATLLGGSFSYRYRAWTLSMLANYQGEKRDRNEQEFPADITTTEYTRFGGRTLMDMQVAYEWRRGLNLFLHADNLFDRAYEAPANRAPNWAGVPGPGRQLVAGVRWQLD